jgi:hypothetical protein
MLLCTSEGNARYNEHASKIETEDVSRILVQFIFFNKHEYDYKMSLMLH